MEHNGSSSSTTSSSTHQQEELTIFDYINSQQFDHLVIRRQLQSSKHGKEAEEEEGEQQHDASSNIDLKQCIPLLARMYLNTFDSTVKQQLYKLLQPYAITSTCLEYENLNWSSIENAVRNEMTIRDKLASDVIQSKRDNDKKKKRMMTAMTTTNEPPISFHKFCEEGLAQSLGEQVISEFENGTFERRARLLLSELTSLIQYYNLMKRTNSSSSSSSLSSSSSSSYIMLANDTPIELLLLSNELYRREVDYIISIAYNHTCDLFSLDDLISVLCTCQFAKDHIISFALNNPSIVNKVATFLVTQVKDNNEEHLYDILQTICSFSCETAYHVRDACLERGTLPRLCLYATFSIIKDTVQFFNACLNTSEGQYIFTHLQKMNRDQSTSSEQLTTLKQVLTCQILEDNMSIAIRCSLLRVCCGLCALSGFSGIDSEENFKKLIQLGTKSSHSTRVVRLILSLFLLNANQHLELSKSCFREMLSSLWEKDQCRDTLLLVATYFHAQLYKNLTSFINTTCNITSVDISMELYESFRPILTEDLIPIDVLAKEILKISPRTVREGENWYALQCVYRMLQSRLLRKHSVDASQWVFKQIQYCSDSEPLPSTMPDIITELVANCTPHPNFSFQMTLFSTEQILEVIEEYDNNKHKDFTPLALILFYMLTVNNNSSIAESYGHDLLGRAHIIEIVSFIQKHRAHLGLLYSQLLSLIVDQLQHLFHLDVILTSAKTFPKASTEGSSIGWMQDREQMTQILLHPTQDQKKTKLALDYLCDLEMEEFKSYENTVISMLPHLLDPHIGRYVLNSYENLWRIMCTRNPMELTLNTVNAVHSFQLSYDDIYKNILVIFGIDARIFRIPPLLSIFLQVLNSFMIASRRFILSSKSNAKNLDNTMQNSYVLTQEGTILQLLLELCLPEDEVMPGDLVLIRKMVCSFVHQRFIDNPVLAKLIHFQTYDPTLLPITVNGVDSIHICMDFLLELLSQPQLEKQVFGVQLASYLCEKYPLQRCIDIACAAIGRIRQIGKLTGSFTTKSAESSSTIAPGGGSQAQNQKSLDAKSSGSTTGNQQGVVQGTVLTKANKKEYEGAIVQLIDTLVRFTVAFPFLSIECVQVMEELKTNFRHDDTIEKLVRSSFSSLTKTIIDNAKK